jgi:hypothetical protein
LPRLFRLGCFTVYFWANENNEPVHVHVSVGNPYANATKIWLTENGGCITAHNKSRISPDDLNEILEAVQAQYIFICNMWKQFNNTDELTFFC